MALEDEIIRRLNQELGKDLKNLKRAKICIKQHQERLKEIRGKIDDNDLKVPSFLKATITEGHKKVEELDSLIEEAASSGKKNDDKLKLFLEMLDSVSDNLRKVTTLQNLVQYVKIQRDIEEISDELKSCIRGKDDHKTIGLYLSLSGDSHSQNSVLGRLRHIEAANLKEFAMKTAVYWHANLTEKLSKDFENVLKSMKWPHFPNVNMEQPVFSKDALNKLTTLAEYLFLIRPPKSSTPGSVTIAPGITCPPISQPVMLLLKPFRQRFQFHFSGVRQTNRLDKPEWYLTQVLSWAKDNHIFVGQNIQPAALKAEFTELNVRLEFVRGLVQLTMEKLYEDIEEIFMDENLFAHLLDEVLSFELELKEYLGYPSTFPSTINILTQGQYLTKWLKIEEDFTSDKMDRILTTGDPWECLDPCNIDELKIPQCADQFLHLLDAIKERYRLLLQPGHQLQFLQLQLDLIENFRRRLVQLHSMGHVSTTKILNAIYYVTSVLREWGENVHYLHLHAALMGPDAEEVNSVFDNSVELWEQWQRKLVKELAGRIVDDIKAKSMPYRHDHWISMFEQNAKEPFILSPTAGEMFQVMVTSLHNLESDLSTSIFSTTLRLIGDKLDEFFLDAMIMNTKFSTGGASQFHFDMTRNLLPLIGQYVRRPDLIFKRVNDSCHLLTLPVGTAMLLHQTLLDSNRKLNHRSSLREIKVINLEPKAALEVLERRNDVAF